MRKLVIVAGLAAIIAGGLFALRTEPGRDLAPLDSLVATPTESAHFSETTQEEAAWLRLRERMNEREAAARGSVVAIDRMAVNETRKALAAADDQRRESAKNHLLEALAWAEMSRRRNARLFLPETRENEVQQQLDNLDMTLTDADRESIQAQAKALHQQLSVDRAELNLGDFDNSEPAMLEKLERQGLDDPAIRNP